MSEIHQLRIQSERTALESVHRDFHLEKLKWARDQSWKAFHEIKNSIQEGMTERQAFELSTEILKSTGAHKSWHKAFVRFGAGTRLSFRDPLQEAYKLQKGDAAYIDLGPVWTDPETEIEYEGDVGDSFVFGTNAVAEECAQDARQLFTQAQTEWKNRKLSGSEIYEFLKKAAAQKSYVLADEVEGHRISDFPHHKYSKERLSKLSFDPTPMLWVLEVHILHPQENLGAFYEDIM